MTALLLYPFIIAAGLLQSVGNSLNAQLRGRLVNPWLTASASFLPIVFVFATLFLVMPTPLPTLKTLSEMPLYAPLSGLAGAVAVFAGLVLVDKVGAGPFNGLTITGNILTSLTLDAFGLFGLHASGFKLLPWIGGLLMVGGIVLISRTSADSGDKEKGDDSGLAGKLLYPFILVAGALQALGAAWNALLRVAFVNPWLAATVSFLPVFFVFAAMLIARPSPLPDREGVARVRWWMALGGIAGAVAVFGGLILIDKVGAGAFNGLLITANLLTSIALDHFGWLGMKQVTAGPQRLGGAGLMVVGILLISVF